MQYRPEIDGLRTIAVLSVIIYHAEFVLGGNTLLAGGFLGVDVFFVISGFLITSLIAAELELGNGFSFASFYERRARRLLPALFLVALVSIPVAIELMLPEALIEFCESIIASLLFASNFYWYTDLQEYGTDPALLKPFLHTWSLAVEEQYYLLFPLLLVALHRFARAQLTLLLVLALLASLAFAEHYTGIDDSLTFYMLVSRFWELLAGGLLALHYERGRQDIASGPLAVVMPGVGVLLIVLSTLLVDEHSHHPGLVTVPAVAGTMLVIWFANSGDMVTRVLASRPMVSIGLVSYSLYLWHYPVLAFARIHLGEPSNAQKLALVALTFVLSYLAYYLVEKPFRNRERVSQRALLITVLATALAILALCASLIQKNGVLAKQPKIIANIETNLQKVSECPLDTTFCSFNEQATPHIYLVGDSHMIALEPPLLTFSRESDIALSLLNIEGCQYLLGLNRVDKSTHKLDKYCTTDAQRKRRDLLLSAPPGVVILGGRLPLLLSEDRFNNREGGDEGYMRDYMQDPANSLDTAAKRKRAIIDSYRRSVLELAQHGHTVVLVYPVPEVGWHVPRAIKRMISRLPEERIEEMLQRYPITTSYAVYTERNRESFELLDSIAHTNIVRIYPHTLFCNTAIEGRCVTHDTENSFYRDDDHLSDIGSAMLIEMIAEAVPTIDRRSRQAN